MEGNNSMITVYTTPTCPKCVVLKEALKEKGLEYTESQNLDIIIEKGFMTVPVMEKDGTFISFVEALKWILEENN